MKYSLALLSAILTTLTSTAHAAAVPLTRRDAPQQFSVTVDDITGFVPLRLFNVKPGDQVTFYMEGTSDHQIVQAIPEDYCVAVAGGLDSGIRYAGTPSTYVYAVPDPFPANAVEFFDLALYNEGRGCGQIGIYNGDTEPAGV